MRELLTYPFDPNLILQKRRKIRRELLESDIVFIEKRIAILGGSTTHDIKEILELFLLNYGIKPSFFESEYNQYWEDAMFDNPELVEFNPDFIFIHTSNRNITSYPTVRTPAQEIDDMLEAQYKHFETMWEHLGAKYNCPIIQNNFEMPMYRLLGNKDVSDIHGKLNFITRLNMKFYEYAQNNKDFFINDINYLSASYGLDKWSESQYWHMYKYALAVPAIPYLSYSVCNIIKSLLGKNKRAFVLDCDNTLWGGVVGDDGVEGIEIGQETPMSQAYSEFQSYIKEHKDLGVMLNINSKNDYENAIAGLNRPDGILKPDDFIVIKANWQNKDQNIREISQELNIFSDVFVFVDDNPVERNIVTSQVPTVAAPEINKVEEYISVIDHSGFFEVTNLSGDDMKRNEMYKANMERQKQQQSFENYEEYLLSLGMTGLIKDFDDTFIQRITQLTNKSNQFNLTTKRFTQPEMDAVAADDSYIRLYGKLEDKFGDNGVVTVVIGKKDSDVLHIDLWLMSCRVLKRNMEHAMLDNLVEQAANQGIKTIRGYYYKTAKNNMVKNFYGEMGFTLVEENGDDTVWELAVDGYENKNNVIKVIHTLSEVTADEQRECFC